jgi:AAA+ superfamily predicted ATPase
MGDGEYPSLSDDSEGEEKDLIEVPVDDYFYKWVDRRLVKISYGKEKLENASSLKSAYLKSYTIKGVFASREIRKLIEGVNAEYKIKNKIPHVYQSDGHYFSRISKVGGKKLSEVILREDVKDRIISDLSEWKNSRKDYERRGIPYKRGHCYYGPPGTGKTTIVKSVAREYGFNVYSINLKKTEDDALISLLRNIEPGSILLFEDIDSTFDGRKRIGSKGVTFSGFLNALDGIVELTGVLVIITTNHIEKMDPALMRAGRMDLKVEISYSTKKEISEYVSSFYNKNIEIKGEGYLPMVEVQNVCLENKNDYKKSIEILEDLLSKSVY